MIPKGFPVGRLRLTQRLSSRPRTPGRTLPPLFRAYPGPAPRWDGRAPLENVARNIQAQNQGSLSQFLAAKTAPTELRTPTPPPMETPAFSPYAPPLLEAAPSSKAASCAWARALLKHAVEHGERLRRRRI